MIDTQEGRIFPTSQVTLVDIHHPTFLEGYRKGRLCHFREPEQITDIQAVEILEFIFEKTVPEDAKVRQEGLYFCVGELFGKVSGPLIPLQPQEEDPLQCQQERFLAEVAKGYGGQGQALRESIQHLWEVHDHLAKRLDADHFDQMLRRGVEKIPLF